MATQDLSEGPRLTGVDAGGQGGSIGMVLLVALVLVGAAVGFLFIGRDHAQPYILFLLSALAVVGVFSLFAFAAGILRIPARRPATRWSRRWPTAPPTASWSPMRAAG